MKENPDQKIFRRKVIEESWKLEINPKHVPNLSFFFKDLAKKFPNNRCFGSRMKKSKKEVILNEKLGKKWIITEYPEKPEDSLIFETYSEVQNDIENISSNLELLLENIEKKNYILFVAETSREWVKFANAVFQTKNSVLATAYPTLGIENIIKILNETESSVLFTSLDIIESFQDEKIDVWKKVPSLKTIVYLQENYLDLKYQNEYEKNYKNPIIEKLVKENKKIIEFEKLLEKKNVKKNNLVENQKNEFSDETAIIMYTSGTMGEPKGVEISHKNILSSVSGIGESIGHLETLDYTYLAYLPLSHIFEFAAEMFILIRGGCLLFGNPRTLSSAAYATRTNSDGTIEKIPSITPKNNGDLEIFKPEILVGVPRVFSTIQKGIENILFEKPKIERSKLIHLVKKKEKKFSKIFSKLFKLLLSHFIAFAFRNAYYFKKKAVLKPRFVCFTKSDGTLEKPDFFGDLFYDSFKNILPFCFFGPRETILWNFLFFNKIKKRLGGKILALIDGGAPLPIKVQEFMRICFSTSFIQGYGLTETCAISLLQNAFLPPKNSIAGVPLNSVEVFLKNCPEVGYDAKTISGTTRNGQKVITCGEILLRGNPVFKRYFKKPELTKESFEGDGFFKTGDFAIMYADGSIEIISRIKNIVKMANGEYVPVEKLESVLNTSHFVQPNGVLCHVDPINSFILAIIQPNWKNIENEYQRKKKSFGDTPKENVMKSIVLSDLQKECFKSGIPQSQIVKEIILDKETWTVENDCLTSSMKLKRRSILKLNEKEIQIINKKYQ